MISSRLWQVSLILSIVLGIGAPARADDFASQVVSHSNLGFAPYDYAGAALGRPTLSYYDLGKPNQIFKTSLVAGAYNLMPPESAPNYDPNDPNSCKAVVTVRTGGYLVVKFDTPIEDDPANWYGKDFIVFGNSAFNGSGLIPGGYVAPDTDMEQYWIDEYADGRWESGVVSVSQYETGPWYTYTDGPYADDFAPTQAYAWDYINHTWGPQMDFTMPLDPSVTKTSFEARQVDGGSYPLSAAEAIDLYKGSGGGTAFDLAGLDLPVNASGRKWIRYIKFAGSGEEIDAVSRVSHAAAPVTIAQARLLADGARVTLTEQTVTAGTDDFADCCYIQTLGGLTGIKVTGRVVARGKRVIVHGVMATDPAGEREIRATCMEVLP